MSDEGALLTRAEVAELTGKVKHKAQHRALTKMGIRHALRPDGSPVVARALITNMLARYADAPAAPTSGPVNLAALLTDGRKKRPL